MKRCTFTSRRWFGTYYEGKGGSNASADGVWAQVGGEVGKLGFWELLEAMDRSV